MSRASLPILDKPTIERLSLRVLPDSDEIERTLVQLAREGNLQGVVEKPPRYSSTTIQWHDECARKFYWPTLAGLEEAPSPAQEVGTQLHKYQEDYLKEGKIPVQTNLAGRLAVLGHKLLPMPRSPGLLVEEPFEMDMDGVPVTGTIDFTRNPTTPDGEPDYNAVGFLLGDHKTKKNKRYPKTKPWLMTNIQSNLYAYARWGILHAMGYESLRIVDKQWVYYFKEDNSVEKLRSVDSLDHVAEQYETRIKPNLLGMQRMVRELPRIGDVPAADKSVCTAYFGCPHYNRCWGMGQRSENMGVVAGNFSKQNIAAKAQNIKAGGGVAAAPVTTPKSAPRTGAGTAVNPPPSRPAPVRAAPPPPMDEEPTEFVDADGNPCDAEGNPFEAVEPEQTPAPAPAPKRTRAKKNARTEQVEAAEPAQDEAPASTPTRSRRAPGFNSGHNFWLFVGCRPAFGFDGEVMPIEHLVGGAQADAANGNDAAHYRDRNSYGALESAFAKWLEENAIVGAVTVDPDTIVARDVVGLLRAHAQVCIERTM